MFQTCLHHTFMQLVLKFLIIHNFMFIIHMITSFMVMNSVVHYTGIKHQTIS